jgi:UDP-2-acetamido-2-deoxy-ribo-hexuluronate aminotransferase
MKPIEKHAEGMPGRKIPFVDLRVQYGALKETINARIQKVLDHGQYIMGPEVGELEEKLASYTRTRHCITVASGTEALLIALMALDIGRGDEVITPSFTFVATAEVIALLGAIPVFVDVEADTANIDASQIEAAITSRTKAILPVSLYGQPADMDEINAIAACRGLPVIEDAAQSFGAEYKGRKSGNLSTIGCTSFFPSKPLGCYGDGGAVFVNDHDLAKAIREIRVHGQERRYHHTRIGVGGRMDTIQCAVILAKLERFQWEVTNRQRIGQHYTQLLAGLEPRIATLVTRADRTSVHAQYTIRSPQRAVLEKYLNSSGIPTAVHYPLSLHQQSAYAQFSRGHDFPISEQLAREVISLPMHADLDKTTQEYIAKLVRDSATAAV